MCVCAHSITQLCSACWDHTGCSPPGSSVHGIFQARILEWVAMPCSSGIFPTQGSNPHLLHGRRILYCWATKEAQNIQVTLPKIMWFKKRLQCLGRVLCLSSAYVFVEKKWTSGLILTPMQFSIGWIGVNLEERILLSAAAVRISFKNLKSVT